MKVKWGAILQVVSTVAKVLALIVIIITGLIKLAQGMALYYRSSDITNIITGLRHNCSFSFAACMDNSRFLLLANRLKIDIKLG